MANIEYGLSFWCLDCKEHHMFKQKEFPSEVCCPVCNSSNIKFDAGFVFEDNKRVSKIDQFGNLSPLPYSHEEYERKSQESREQMKQKHEEYMRSQNKSSLKRVHCPYCNSTNCKKLGAISRGVSFGLFGFGSGKIGKQWHCNDCRSDF